MNAIKSMFTVGGYTLLYRITSLIRDSLQAAILGAGPITDAFAVAFKLANILRKLFAEGAFNAAFLPRFSGILNKEGKNVAEVMASQVLTLLALILAIIAIVSFSGFSWIIKGLAPGFKVGSEQYHYAIELGYICFPFVLTSFIVALFGGILNAINKFAMPAGVQLALNICVITALVLGYFGLPNIAHMMAWATLISGVLQVLILWTNVKKHGFSIRITMKKPSSEATAVIKRIIPGAVGAGVWQINILIGCISLASFLPSGSVSYIYYTDHVNQIPLGIIGISLSTVLLPPLSKFLQAKNIKGASAQLNMGVVFGLALILPTTVLFSVLSEPMTGMFYGHGKFGPTQVHNAAPALAAFALGLPSYILTKIFSTTFFAQKNVKIPVIAGGIALVANFVAAFFFIPAFKEIGLGHVGIAAAISVSSWVNMFVLYGVLIRKGELHVLNKTWLACFKLLIATGAMTVSVYGMDIYATDYYMCGAFTQAITVIIITVISSLIFWAVGRTLGAFSAIKEYEKIAEECAKDK